MADRRSPLLHGYGSESRFHNVAGSVDAPCFNALCRGSEIDSDTLLAEQVSHPAGKFSIHCRDQPASEVGHGDLCPDGMTDRGELHPDWPAAHNEDVSRRAPAIQDRIRIADAWDVERDIFRPAGPRPCCDPGSFSRGACVPVHPCRRPPRVPSLNRIKTGPEAGSALRPRPRYARLRWSPFPPPQWETFTPPLIPMPCYATITTGAHGSDQARPARQNQTNTDRTKSSATPLGTL
jgi:hypothetical protein